MQNIPASSFGRVLVEVATQQEGLVCDYPAGTAGDGSQHFLLGVADPVESHHASFSQMPHKRPKKLIRYLQRSEEQPRFEAISPLAPLPIMKILGIQRNLQGTGLNLHKRQPTRQIGHRYLHYFPVTRKRHDPGVRPPKIFLHFSTNSQYGVLVTSVEVDQVEQLGDCLQGGSFKFNIHWHCRKPVENLPQSGDLLAPGLGHPALLRELQPNFPSKPRQILPIVLLDQPLNSTGAGEIEIMMDDQSAILCHADIHLQHVTRPLSTLERLHSILDPLPRSPAVPHHQHAPPPETPRPERVGRGLATAGRKAKEQKTGSQVARCDYFEGEGEHGLTVR